jgi:hypothetical protein
MPFDSDVSFYSRQAYKEGHQAGIAEERARWEAKVAAVSGLHPSSYGNYDHGFFDAVNAVLTILTDDTDEGAK